MQFLTITLLTTCFFGLTIAAPTTPVINRQDDSTSSSACTDGNPGGSVACVETFNGCMQAAGNDPGQIVSCALALSSCEVGANTKTL